MNNENTWRNNFATEEEFVEHIENNQGLFEFDRRKIIEHEQAHFLKAVELEYQPFYGYLRTLSKETFVVEESYYVGLKRNGQEAVRHYKELIAIASAPSELSEDDRKIIKDAKEKLKLFRSQRRYDYNC